MKKVPTDLQILEEIYKRYYPSFTSFSPEQADSLCQGLCAN